MAFKDLKNLRDIASGTTLAKDITGTDALSGMFSVAQLAFGVNGLTKVSEVMKSRSGVGNEIRNDSELCKSTDKLTDNFVHKLAQICFDFHQFKYFDWSIWWW